MSALELLIQTYGYLAVLLGGAMESDSLLVLGGFAARRGHLTLAGVIAIAFLGTSTGAQLLFFLGQRHSRFILSRLPRLAGRIERGQQLLERHRMAMILGFRFTYGLRSVIPFALGLSQISAYEFLILNLIGALVWCAVMSTAGYLFGAVMEAVLEDVEQYELAVIAAILAVAVLVWAVSLYRKGRKGSRAG